MASFSQSEQAPLREFTFNVSVSHLKTQDQVDHVLVALSKLNGVSNEKFVLTDYALSFTASNHDMQKHALMDSLKAILSVEGIEIVKIERKENQ